MPLAVLKLSRCGRWPKRWAAARPPLTVTSKTRARSWLAFGRRSLIGCRYCWRQRKPASRTRFPGRAHTKVFVDFAFNEPNAYRLVFDLYQADEATFPEMARANARSVKVSAGYVERLIAEGHLEGDPEHMGYLYFAALHGLIVLRMSGRHACTREQFDRNCRQIIRLITQGSRSTSSQKVP